jgi:two-component system LytT family sensor kinase
MTSLRRALLLIAVWSVPACLTVAESRTLAHLQGTRAPPLRLVVPTFVEWYFWALLTPLILRFSARFPLNRARIARSIPAHALGMLVATVLSGVVYSAAGAVLATRRPPGTFLFLTTRLIVGRLPLCAVVYGAIVAAGAALDFARRLSEREAAAAQLREQLARAQLDAIRARIHPHFLFNALHSVGALVRSGERDDAVRIVSDLGDLLREVLAQDTPDLVPLSSELGFVKRYLDIELIRFSDRLRVEWDVDSSLNDALVPPLLVQALVENAVRHGISRSLTAGQLRIAACETDGMIEIVVADDGPGPRENDDEDDGSQASTGFGINAARQRLRALFGETADVSIAEGERGGTIARINMPLRREDSLTARIGADEER